MTDEIDAETSALMTELWQELADERDVDSGDWWSACFRPGSWEYNRPYAEQLRRKLTERGYTEHGDPDRPWGTTWRRA